MDPSGAGEIAAGARKRAKPLSDSAATGVDHLSALHDDILAQILSSLSSPDAVGTCVLSTRWLPVWKLLPHLHLPFFPDAAGEFRDALDSHLVPLRHLKVEGDGHGEGGLPRSIATWLPAAARRVTGCFTLLFDDEAPTRDVQGEDEEAVAIELPCFKHATSISIDLWFRCRLAFPVPPAAGAGVFSHLTDLSLEDILFQDPGALGDVISSPRCPCLKSFYICHGRGLEKLAVSSTTVVKLHVELLHGLQQLIVDTPELEELHVVDCFLAPPDVPPPEYSITAPGLEVLEWRDPSTQGTLPFSRRSLPHLHSLGAFLFFVYGDDDIDSYNRDTLRILQGFPSIETLTLMLGFYAPDYEYLMEAMTALPDLTTLHLIVMSTGHCFGDSSLHVLRICTGIRKLILELSCYPDESKESTCPLDCICRERSNWQTEELVLVCLQEIEIQGFARSDHDIGFVEQLFGWATSLAKATIIFDESVTEGVAKELCWMFQVFTMPKLHIDFRYHNNKKVLSAPAE